MQTKLAVTPEVTAVSHGALTDDAIDALAALLIALSDEPTKAEQPATPAKESWPHGKYHKEIPD